MNSSFFAREIATVVKPSASILSGDGEQRLGNGIFKSLRGPGFRTTKEGFELRKSFLDGREIGGISRKKEQMTSLIFNELAHMSSLMRSKIIHDHDLPLLQLWDQDILDIDLKSTSIG